MRKTPHEILRAADFLIIDALDRQPMTTRELCHKLQLAAPAVARRLKRYAELGLVVKRSPDRKWVTAVRLRVETPAETAEELGHPLPIGRPEPKVEKGTVVWPEMPELAPPPKREVPDPTPPPPPPKQYTPPKPEVEVSKRAQDMAKRLRIPAHLPKYGELTTSKAARCVGCGNGTPFHYGSTAVCPKCSRGGK